jgi:hypothetical protein
MEMLQTHCYATEPSRYYRNAIKASQYCIYSYPCLLYYVQKTEHLKVACHIYQRICYRYLCSSSSWVLQPDSSQDRLNYASPPDPIRRYFFPVSNPLCLQILLNIVQPSYWWSSFFLCSNWLTEGLLKQLKSVSVAGSDSNQ